MNGSNLKIGEIAIHSGVSVDTVRYYERLNLLPRAARSSGGFRIFPAETVELIRFIKEAQEMDFSLDEVNQLFSIGGANQCRAVREFLMKKLGDLESKMNQMRNFRKVLNRQLDKCDNGLLSKVLQVPNLCGLRVN